jgi:hypothetical protein
MKFSSLSDPSTRASALMLTQEAPFKMPLIVKEGWGIIALIIIVGFIPSLLITAKICTFIVPLLVIIPGMKSFLTLELLVLVAFLVIALPAICLVYYIAGRYTCRLTLYFVSNERLEDAKIVALGFQHTIYYLHLKQNDEFASFIRTSNLTSESDRYAKFINRLDKKL